MDLEDDLQQQSLQDERESSPPREPYIPLNSDLFLNQFQQEWFDLEFLRFYLSLQMNASIPELIQSYSLTEIAPHIYSIPCFSLNFCQILLRECENYIEYANRNSLPIHRPNSMNRYGLVLTKIGMEPLITDLQQNYLLPISRKFFPIEASEFTSHHSFIVSYEPQRDRALDLHTDDSDVTWNICLGKEFTGSGLTFCGQIAQADHRQYKCSYQHRLGHAVIHLGQQRHGAENITSGERHNLIVWCRNDSYRLSESYRANMRKYQKESSPPDRRCVSYTHDRDYILYHDDYPPGKNPFNLSDGQHEEDQDEVESFHDTHLPWCPPVRFGYDGIPTPNHLMKIIYTKLVDGEERKRQQMQKRKISGGES
jgi:hypothetical protein